MKPRTRSRRIARPFVVVSLFAFLIASCTTAGGELTEPMDAWGLSTGKLGLEAKEKFVDAMAVGEIKAVDMKVFANLSAAITDSLRENGLLQVEGSKPKYILNVEVVRFESVADRLLYGKYTATLKYELIDAATKEIAYENTFETSSDSNEVLGESAETERNKFTQKIDRAASMLTLSFLT